MGYILENRRYLKPPPPLPMPPPLFIAGAEQSMNQGIVGKPFFYHGHCSARFIFSLVLSLFKDIHKVYRNVEKGR